MTESGVGEAWALIQQKRSMRRTLAFFSGLRRCEWTVEVSQVETGRVRESREAFGLDGEVEVSLFLQGVKAAFDARCAEIDARLAELGCAV